MKNFACALLVFILWGTLSLYYLKQKHDVEFTEKDLPTESTNANKSSINSANSDPLYIDNTLLSLEMERIVARIKSDHSKIKATQIAKDQGPDTIIPELQIDMLFPDYDQEKLISTRELNDYGKELAEKVKQNPKMEITIVGHHYGKETSLDNYLEALTRAKSLRNYLSEHFNISENNISAISEGESRPLRQNDVKQTTGDTRLEVMTKKLK